MDKQASVLSPISFAVTLIFTDSHQVDTKDRLIPVWQNPWRWSYAWPSSQSGTRNSFWHKTWRKDLY